ncbi:transcriptional regulator FtsR [Streptomyces sudanensis]|uniref:transcriptional regulator FtsR n=1 Tax=Streptomyces sudanensis TaxID=436397 RepID=UPI003FD7DC36
MRRTPTGGAGNGTAGAGDRLVSIGTVLNQLRGEFPEVTISKIRFLEAEGLVEPQRTASGYRKFSPDDVERLALILRMQRDHYLPLKVIREHLAALGRGSGSFCPPPARAASRRTAAARGSRTRRGAPRPGGSTARSCSPPPGRARGSSPNGSRTGWSSRPPTAATTPRR